MQFVIVFNCFCSFLVVVVVFDGCEETFPRDNLRHLCGPVAHVAVCGVSVIVVVVWVEYGVTAECVCDNVQFSHAPCDLEVV